MKNLRILAFALFLGGLLSTSMTSCKTGYGCPAEEAYYKNKDQQMNTKKRGNSNLFDKKTRKKIKKKG